MLMVFGCKKESDVIVQESQIEYNQITEAYFGDSNELTIKANAANAVTLYIDGEETASGANGSIRYNISNLPVGVHTIKIQFVVGGDTFEKSFKCNIIAKPVIYEIPTLTCTQITESYVGESAVITASTETASKIILFVDGVETKTSDTQTLSFDIQGLNIGTHKIKFVSENGDKKDQKEFNCKIKPIIYEIPTLTCTQITESYVGESAVITASTETASKITLFVDGVETKTSDTQTLSFDIQGLNIGTHKIKFVSENGDKKDQKEFDCKILEVVEEYDYVDLGLPSGTLWATCNVGAKNPWEYGDYFAWGETEPKENYFWWTYKYAISNAHELTKYCLNPEYGYNGFTDNLTVLEHEDDAAVANMGNKWRMPTEEDFQELLDNCEREWTSNYQGTGVAGNIIWHPQHTSHIFFPASGFRSGFYLFQDDMGYYWTSSLMLILNASDYGCNGVYFGANTEMKVNWVSREQGFPVRAVHK